MGRVVETVKFNLHKIHKTIQYEGTYSGVTAIRLVFGNKTETKVTAREACDKIEELLESPSNREGNFQHEKSKQWVRLIFDGQAMFHQAAMISIVKEFEYRKNMPEFITIETNGTQMPQEPFLKYFYSGVVDEQRSYGFYKKALEKRDVVGKELFWSVSPIVDLEKDWTTTLNLLVLREYKNISPYGQFKFEIDGDPEHWQRIEKIIEVCKDSKIDWDIWIKPKENDRELVKQILDRGYHVIIDLENPYIVSST